MSEAGLKIAQAKIKSALDFPSPTVCEQPKSFSGTVNSLRDYVRSNPNLSFKKQWCNSMLSKFKFTKI